MYLNFLKLDQSGILRETVSDEASDTNVITEPVHDLGQATEIVCGHLLVDGFKSQCCLKSTV